MPRTRMEPGTLSSRFSSAVLCTLFLCWYLSEPQFPHVNNEGRLAFPVLNNDDANDCDIYCAILWAQALQLNVFAWLVSFCLHMNSVGQILLLSHFTDAETATQRQRGWFSLFETNKNAFQLGHGEAGGSPAVGEI